jgi:hypothetical protein
MMGITATQLRPRPDARSYCDCPACRELGCWADEAEDLIRDMRLALAEATGEDMEDEA